MAYDQPERKKKRPRIAFSGEEYGFGYQAVGKFLDHAQNYAVSDGGLRAVKGKRQEREIFTKEAREVFGRENAIRQPLRTKEQSLLAVKSGTADYAVVPFYHPFYGYDFETLRAMSNLFTLLGVEQYSAGDHLCLAVPENQALEIAQSSHPGSGLSSLLKKERRSWGSGESLNPDLRFPDISEAREQYRAGLVVDQAAQMMLRDRLDVVFAGPEEARRAKTKLDGLRATGVDISETPRAVEPHRELLKRARASLDPNRVVNTFHNPRTGESHYMSALSANGAGSQQLFGVVLPFQVAMMSNDYIIIDDNIEDDAPLDSRFMVVSQVPDHTLYDDAYRTTDAKTRYWNRRLLHLHDRARDDGDKEGGVRVMFRFRRDGSAASIGDVENFLRNYGVRHTVVRLDEDSERDMPASILLDVEFDARDFDHNPISMMTRRLRGSVVNGALKKSFQRWKNRGVTILAAMPFDEAQLPQHRKRRWWNEAATAWMEDFVETMFIRLSRVLFIYGLPTAIVAYLIWKYLLNG